MLIVKIHNSKKRMPIVLDKEREKEWLNRRGLQHFAKIETEVERII